MITFQVRAATTRKAKSRSLYLISPRQVPLTQNASTDSGHHPQGAGKSGREGRTETDIGRATKTEKETETATGEERGMTDTEGGGTTGKEEKTGTGTEAERMTERGAGGTRTGGTGTRGETGAPEKEIGTRMATGRGEGSRKKTNGGRKIGKERGREGTIERRRHRQRKGNGRIPKRERRRRRSRKRKARITGTWRRRSTSLQSAAQIRRWARRETGTWPDRSHAQPPRATLKKKRTEQVSTPIISLYYVSICKAIFSL